MWIKIDNWCQMPDSVSQLMTSYLKSYLYIFGMSCINRKNSENYISLISISNAVVLKNQKCKCPIYRWYNVKIQP